MMQYEVVERRKWLTKEQFLDLLGAANLLPGPSSTELALFIGYRRARGLGLLLAGFCFILPAALIVSIIAWLYVRYGSLPQVSRVLLGVKPVVIAIIAQALWNLGRTAVKSPYLAGIGVLAIAATLLAVNPLLVLFGAGGLTVAQAWKTVRTEGTGPLKLLAGVACVLGGMPWLLGRLAAPRHLNLTSLFLAFLRLGSVVYGSGYVLLAFLRIDLVAQRGWLTSAQLLDAVAVGQVTPGPVFTTATFIGYLLAGGWGAGVATLGTFLPAFVLVAVSGPLIPKLRKSAVVGAFLNGVNVASLALMAVVAVQLAVSVLTAPIPVLIGVVSAIMLLRYRVNSAWLVLGGAVVGVACMR
jgi:chromate transporter